MDEIIYETPVKVLLVDDEENILHSLKRLLMEENIETLAAGSGEKALAILNSEEDIGLIISDQRMPGLTGVDFLEQAKKIRPLATRILLTGYSDIKAAIDAINIGGAMKYLTKPWKDEEILTTVRDACQRYVLLQHNKRLSAIVKRQNEELKQWSQQLEIMVQEQTIELSRQNDMLKVYYDRQKNNFKTIIASLTSLIDLRDKSMKSHSRNVAEISYKVALAMQLSREEVEVIFVASLLHDIGKIGLSDFLLTKDVEDFAKEELEEYCVHPVRGQAAIDAIEDLRDAGILIRHHHESFDGTGFPDNLTGTEIPLGSRIISIADFVDRLMGKTFTENAFEFILDAVKVKLGKRFDPIIFPFIQKPLIDIYTRIELNGGALERELEPNKLNEGMVLSRDVWSGSGLLLLSKGIVLERPTIMAIIRYYQIDPPKRGIFVQTQR